jgi:hypothetical protein
MFRDHFPKKKKKFLSSTSVYTWTEKKKFKPKEINSVTKNNTDWCYMSIHTDILSFQTNNAFPWFHSNLKFMYENDRFVVSN